MLGVVRHILLIVAVFLPLLMDGSPAVTPGGLRFTAAPENTSLDLFSGKRKPFVGETAIGFDMKIFNPESFGQILALDIPDNPFILTLVSIPGKGPTLVLSSQNDRGHFVEIPYAEIVSDISEWEHVELSICPDEGRIQLSLCGKSWTLDDTRLFRKFRMNILFGGNGGASVVESPEIAIRQIVIANGKKSLAFPLDEAKGNIVKNIQMGKKGITLKNGVDLTLVRRHTIDDFSFKNDFAAVRRLKAGNDAKRCGFSAAGGAKQRNKLPVADVQIDVFKHRLPVKADGDIFQVNDHCVFFQLCSPFPTDRYSRDHGNPCPIWYDTHIRENSQKSQ